MNHHLPEPDPLLALALRRLIGPEERHWIVAVSGGADSIYLLHQCAREADRRGIRPTILHVNHGLRGMESDRDEAFVRAQARTLRLDLHVVRARPRQPLAGNVSDQARRLRRHALLEAAGLKGLILLGQHAGDQRESVLMGLLKGKGALGSAGMRERQGRWIRPLLGLDGIWLRQRLQRQALSWREDASNAQPWCERNHLRLSLLAEQGRILDGELRRTLDSIVGTLSHWRAEAEKLSSDLLDQLELQPHPCGVSLERPTALSYHERQYREALRLLGRRWGAWSRDPSNSNLNHATALWLRGSAGSCASLGPVRLELGRQRACLVLREVQPLELLLEPGGVVDGSWGRIGWGAAPAQVEWRWQPAVKVSRVILRRWQAGDRLPRADGKGPLLADLMGQLGFTPVDKRLQVVLCDATGRVLACPGVGPLSRHEGETHNPIWMTSCPSPSTR